MFLLAILAGCSHIEVEQAFKKGELNCDVIVVVRFQGPKANGMPELHGLTSILSIDYY